MLTKTQKALSMMCTAYKGKGFTADNAKTYGLMLNPKFPDDVMAHAISICIHKYVFPPSIKELEDEARGIMREVTGKREKDVSEAWQEVRMQIAAFGSYGKPHFDDEITRMVVKRIGWATLCDGRPGAMYPEFKRIYEKIKSEGQDKERRQAVIRSGAINQTLQALAARGVNVKQIGARK